MTILELGEKRQVITRRGLLIGGGAAVGLVVAWGLWPRVYRPNLVANPGESILNGYVKIGTDGHVTVVVPQIELGQGAFTLIPQIVADELGAEWRTVAVEPAPLNPIYGNELFGENWPKSAKEAAFGMTPLQITGGSTSVRAFEPHLRQAAAAARVLLCKAAAKRWDADWLACDTAGGFVSRGGNEKLRFGELVQEAARFSAPDPAPLREGRENRLAGKSLPRLDLPSKVDGSANYAGDIRLPDMVYAAIRHGPLGDSRLVKVNEAAAKSVIGVLAVVRRERWVAVAATNWWAANRTLDLMKPRFANYTASATDAGVERGLAVGFNAKGRRVLEVGEVTSAFGGPQLHKAEYVVGLAPHAAIEPLSATASIENGLLQLWLPTQAAGLARAAAAKAISFSQDSVIIHPMLVGGSFGRKYEVEIAAEVAILAAELKRPVQLIWSRAEDMMHDRFRPAASARMAAKLGAGGKIEAWQARIAAPFALGEMRGRIQDGLRADEAHAAWTGSTDALATDGAEPPYGIPVVSVDHYPADIGVPTGKWRSGTNSYTAFFNESFIDELAHISGIEPFSFRMGLLIGNPRLARCLTTATTLGGWDGGSDGSSMGIACHAMLGSYVAVLAQAHIGDNQRVSVTKLVAVADVGRQLNPDIVKQQIEGGLIFGLAAATGNRVEIKRGIAGPTRFGALGLPRLVDVPDVTVEIIGSNEAPGGVGEVAVPPVAPAIANALFAATGRRFRRLPLAPGNP
jgi:isoquinoline 1-oxidoreductase subunit beta